MEGQRFLEAFEVVQPSGIHNVPGLLALCGSTVRLRLRDVPEIVLRGTVLDDQSGGLILDLSFGIAIVDAVQKFDLTAQDFAPSDLAVELLFLQEAKSCAMAASFNLSTRLDGARLVAENEAATDGLTGLHNRRALDNAMARLGQSETEHAVLHMDLDLFKQVNDTYGHAVGDAVLTRVANIMRQHTRKDDVLIRAGGDEFIIVCPGLVDKARLAHLSTDLIADISEQAVIDGHSVEISASIGIASSPQVCRAKLRKVTDIADIALYAAKRSGRGTFVFWSPELGESLVDLQMTSNAKR